MKDNTKIRLVKLLNIILLAIPFIVVWLTYYNNTMTEPYQWKGNLAMCIIFLILYYFFGKIYDAFNFQIARISDLIYSQMLGVLISDGIIYLIILLLTEKLPNLVPGLLCILAQLLLSIIYSNLVNNWYFNTFSSSPSIIIYDKKQSISSLIDEYGLEKRYKIEKVLNVKKILDELDMLDKYEAVFLTDLHSHERNIILKYCVENNISVYVIPKIGDIVMSGAHNIHMFHFPVLMINRYDAQPEYLLAKRIIDIILSLIALVILSPIIVITSIAIKCDDGGPIFYKQTRLTKDGKEFEILKFRSMKIDAEKDGKALLSTGDKDDRVTKVGKFIRKVRIDELPQLINILKGDLSIVGPRPERPEIAKEYEKKLPEFRLRLQAKAGLTGYAQVYGKYNTTPYNKLQMDLMYIAHPSLIEDFKIMLATIKIIFIPESTEGIEEGKTNAQD